MSGYLKDLPYRQYIYYVTWFLCFSIPIPYSNGRVGFLSSILFLLWLAEGELKRKFHTLFQNRLFLCLFAILAYSFLSLWWSKYTEVGLETLNPYKYYLLAIPPIVTSIDREKAIRLVFAFILGVTVHAVTAYGAIFFELPELVAEKIYRPYAIYAPFTAFASLYFLSRFFRRPDLSRGQILSLLLFAFLAVLLFVMPGRSGQIGFLAGLILLILLYYGKSMATVLLTVAGVVFVTSLLVNIDTTRLKYSAAKKEMMGALVESEYKYSWGTRIGLLLCSLDVAKRNPVFGAGVGDSRDTFQRVIERGGNQSFYALANLDSPHNQFMTQLTKLGAVGLLLMLIYIVLFYRLNITNDELKKLGTVFITLFCINCFADEILFMKPYNTYFAVFSAIFMNLVSKGDRSGLIEHAEALSN